MHQIPTYRFRLSAENPVPVQIAKGSNTEGADTDLLKISLQAHGEAYKDLTQSWRSIEAKAQGTAGVAGIFLAGAFAFARELPRAIREEAVWLLIGAVILLTLSAIIALWAQRIQEMPNAPSSLLVHHWIEDIRRLAPVAERQQRLVGLYEDYNDAWLRTNTRLLAIINKKAVYVRVSQVSLLLAGSLVAAMTILVVLASHPQPTDGGQNADVHEMRT